MSPRRAVGVLAGIVLAVGLIMLLKPVSAGDVDCGSAAFPQPAAAVIEDIMERPLISYEARCENELSDQRLLAWPVASAGALVLLYMALTKPTRWDRKEAAPGDPAAPLEDRG